MRSLQFKFSALVVALLVLASIALTWLATRHERSSLEAEVSKRGLALASNLAEDAKVPLLAEDQLALENLVGHVGAGEGLVASRLLDQTGSIVASLAPDETGLVLEPQTTGAAEGPTIGRIRSVLWIAAPVIYSDVRIGEAQIALDLELLVAPVVADSQNQLSAAAAGILVLGVVGGIVFVALLIGPIRRLRTGVEQLAGGDLATRVPPTSQDEVGDLTRAFNKMGESLQEKERIQSAFGRYVNDYVLTTLLEGPEGAQLAGAEREVTILFADIRSFTRLSEGLKAADVVGLLNDVFQLASDCILARSGTIDKFIGDSVMAYFGAPVPCEDHAAQAVQAAIDIERAVAKRNASQPPPTHAVDVGIGIHTGPVIVGTIGSDRRSDFTAIGDAVNVAHRLEKLSRPGEVLVSEAVQRRVRDVVRLRFEGERQLSGRVEPVHVYSVEIQSGA
ncbi:MAG: HAMP domain-containing protein [bacterium]|nr:HAMP domain-containing protein [bacterium]